MKVTVKSKEELAKMTLHVYFINSQNDWHERSYAKAMEIHGQIVNVELLDKSYEPYSGLAMWVRDKYRYHEYNEMTGEQYTWFFCQEWVYTMREKLELL